jgi:hypothetical protein
MRHHFVPQFLLRAWADGSSDGKLQEFLVDHAGVPTSRRAPKGTGFQDDLYALSKDNVAGMDKHAVETTFLSRLDDEGAKIRRKLLEGKPLTGDEVSVWTTFVMGLRARQPAMVTRIKSAVAAAMRESIAKDPEQYQALAKAADPPTLEEWTEQHFPGLIENYGLSMLADIAGHEEVAAKVRKLLWGVMDVSKGKHDLLLSDQPCVWTGGIDAPQLIIALPLSPSKAFLAVRGEATANALVRADTAELAKRLNENSVGQAQRRVYARDETVADFVRDVMVRKKAS